MPYLVPDDGAPEMIDFDREKVVYVPDDPVAGAAALRALARGYEARASCAETGSHTLEKGSSGCIRCGMSIDEIVERQRQR